MTAKVGGSGSVSKTITIPSGFICPKSVDKNNWIGGWWDAFGDTFSISQTGTQVTATRTDRPHGWDMNLQFNCCQYGSNNFFYDSNPFS